MIFLPTSLHSKLVPVHYREHEFGLLLDTQADNASTSPGHSLWRASRKQCKQVWLSESGSLLNARLNFWPAGLSSTPFFQARLRLAAWPWRWTLSLSRPKPCWTCPVPAHDTKIKLQRLWWSSVTWMWHGVDLARVGDQKSWVPFKTWLVSVCCLIKLTLTCSGFFHPRPGCSKAG